jgi:hypothetical protein
MTCWPSAAVRFSGDHSANRVNAATGRERDDRRDRTDGIVLGHRWRAIGERNEHYTKKFDFVIQSKHGNLPLRVTRVPSTLAIKTENLGQQNGLVVHMDASARPTPTASSS